MENVSLALEKKWKKYVRSLLMLIILSVALLFYLLNGKVVISNGNLTTDGKFTIFYISMFILINLSYACFILNRFQKYQNEISVKTELALKEQKV